MNPIDYFKSASDMSSQIRVSSILNPLLWMLPALIFGLVLVGFGGSILVQWFFIIMVSVVIFCILIVFLFVLFYGVFKNPNILTLLRSEDYSVKMKYLEQIGDHKHTFLEVENSTPQNNPEFPNPSLSTPLPTKDLDV